MSAVALLVLVTATAQLAPAQGPPAAPPESSWHEIKPVRLWGGVLPDESLRRHAPASGIVQGQEALEELWTEWRPGEDTPTIDFKKHFVFVDTIDGPNRMFVNLRKDDKGSLKTTFGGTKIGGPGFGYLIVAVAREGITRVNGKRLETLDEASQPSQETERPTEGENMREFVRIAIEGQLETGIAAIGGETTGTVIRAKGMTFELAFDDPAMQGQASTLNGKRVLVTGDLARVEGVERGPRWIVKVNWISSTGD